MSELVLQAFRHFTYVTAHSPTLPSLYLRHSSFSNPSVALPTSQLILQPFRPFLRHRSFSNPSFAYPTSQALHLRHLASRPCLNRNVFQLTQPHHAASFPITKLTARLARCGRTKPGSTTRNIWNAFCRHSNSYL